MILSESNFLLYAAKYYDNKSCSSVEEFEEDLKRFKYLKKLFYNYRNKDIMRERLILNHIVILYNIFSAKPCTNMLVLKLEDYLPELLPFLDILGYTPNYPINIKDETYYIQINNIERDALVQESLKKIVRTS